MSGYMDDMEMPTELVRRKPSKKQSVSRCDECDYKHSYKALQSDFDELLDVANQMQETINDQNKMIEELQQMLSQALELLDEQDCDVAQELLPDDMDTYEPGVLKVRMDSNGVHVARPEEKKKLAGASLVYDPVKKKLGVGLHFKTTKK